MIVRIALTAFFCLLFIFSSCTSQPSSSSSGTLNNSSAAAATPDLSLTASYNQIQLVWTNYQTSNLASFGVYRATNVSGPYLCIANLATNVTNYIDTNIYDYTEYFYRIDYQDATNGIFGYSSIQQVYTSWLDIVHPITAK
jgi:hypothetical protein